MGVYNNNSILVKILKFSTLDCQNKTNVSGNLIVSNFDLPEVYFVASCRMMQRDEDKKNKSNSLFCKGILYLKLMVLSIIHVKRTTVWSTVRWLLRAYSLLYFLQIRNSHVMNYGYSRERVLPISYKVLYRYDYSKQNYFSFNKY